jgi:hypothetical protein
VASRHIRHSIFSEIFLSAGKHVHERHPPPFFVFFVYFVMRNGASVNHEPYLISLSFISFVHDGDVKH